MPISFPNLLERIKINPEILAKRVRSGSLPAHRANPQNRATWTVEEDDFRNFIETNLNLGCDDNLEEIVDEFLNKKWATTVELADSGDEEHVVYGCVKAGFFSYVNIAFEGSQKKRYRFPESTADKIKKIIDEKRKSRSGKLFYLNQELASKLGCSSPEELAEHTPKKYLRPCLDPRKDFYLTPKGYQIMLARHQKKIAQENDLLKKLKQHKTTDDLVRCKSLTHQGAWSSFKIMYDLQQRLKKEGYQLPSNCEMFRQGRRYYMPNRLFQRIIKEERKYQRYWVGQWLKKNSRIKST